MKKLFTALAVLTAVALGASAPVACGAHSGVAPARDQAAEKGPWDAGLPPPPASSKRGVIVPSDMGLGAGPAGPTNNGGAPSPLSPPTPNPTSGR